MKFDSSAAPLLPTPRQLIELNDLLVSATELYQSYAALERHPRVLESPRSAELFALCVEQVNQDITILDEQLGQLLTLAKTGETQNSVNSTQDTAYFAYASGGDSHPIHIVPDREPTDLKKSVFEIVRQGFQREDFFKQNLVACLNSAQERKHLKLELQLKMIILAADQRCLLLEDRYGYARSKSLLFQGLRRQTTRFLSHLNGDKRTDIDQ